MLEEKTEVRLSIRHNWNTAKLKDLLFLVKSVLFGFDDAGTVAEWSKALLLREKINENPMIPASPPNTTSSQCYIRFTGLYLQVCRNRPIFPLNLLVQSQKSGW